MELLAGLDTDLTKELAMVRALIAQNGRPILTEEILKDVEAAQAAFVVGDVVKVLQGGRPSSVTRVLGTGRIDRITYVSTTGEPIYWVSGFLVGRSASVLRRVAQ